MDTANNGFRGGRYLVILIALFFSALAFAGTVSAGSPTAGNSDSKEPAHYTHTPTVTREPTSTPTNTPTPCTVRFADVPDGSTFFKPVYCLACKGIIGGYACGGEGEPCNENNDPYFRPNAPVTRGQVAKIVAISAGFNDDVSGQLFEDVPPGSTFYAYVQRLAERDIVGGYACGGVNEPCVAPDNRPYFRVYDHTTRAQVVKIVRRAAHAGGEMKTSTTEQTFADVPVGSTYYTDVEGLLDEAPDIISGYPCGDPSMPCDNEQRPYFRPQREITRGQTAKIVVRRFFPECLQ